MSWNANDYNFEKLDRARDIEAAAEAEAERDDARERESAAEEAWIDPDERLPEPIRASLETGLAAWLTAVKNGRAA